MRVGVIGPRSMGFGMASASPRAGHSVWDIDVRADSVARLLSEGEIAGDLSKTAATLEAPVVVVLNTAQMEAVLFGPVGGPRGCRRARWSSTA